MRDWKEFVRHRIPSCALPRVVYEEVIAELASHMEEVHHQAVVDKLAADAVEQLMLQEAGNWRALASQIQQAKSSGGVMNHRTRSLWLPALVTLLGASLSLTATELARVQPRLIWVLGVGVTLYWPWLASLPLLGATGAYLSFRARGSIRSRVMAALSPALVMLIVIAAILPFGLAIDGFHFLRLVSFGIGLMNWVFIPGIALLIGTAPLLRTKASNTQVEHQS